MVSMCRMPYAMDDYDWAPGHDEICDLYGACVTRGYPAAATLAPAADAAKPQLERTQSLRVVHPSSGSWSSPPTGRAAA